jgi:hypothetical protein
MEFLLAWENLIFLIPILVGVVASLALATGFGGEVGEGDAETGEGADMDDASIDSDVDDVTDHDGSGDGHSDQSMLQQALSLLGVGKVPLSIVIMLSSLSFGIVGMLSNVLFGMVYISLIIGLFAMIIITASCAKNMSKIVPSLETRTVSQRDLLGMQAHLILPASPSTGLAHVRDQFGTLHQIRCRTTQGEISDGRDVVILDYNEQEGIYIVTAEIPILQRSRERSFVSQTQNMAQEGGVNESENSQLSREQKKQSE